MTTCTTPGGITFSDADIVEGDGFDYFKGSYNPYMVHAFVLHDHGFVVAVVMASNLQDAIDYAVDADKMDRYLIDVNNQRERDDYMTNDPAKMAAGFDPECPERVIDGVKYWWKVEPSFLGNASEPFDIETLQCEELPSIPFSWCAQYNAAQELKQRIAKDISQAASLATDFGGK